MLQEWNRVTELSKMRFFTFDFKNWSTDTNETLSVRVVATYKNRSLSSLFPFPSHPVPFHSFKTVVDKKNTYAEISHKNFCANYRILRPIFVRVWKEVESYNPRSSRGRQIFPGLRRPLVFLKVCNVSLIRYLYDVIQSKRLRYRLLSEPAFLSCFACMKIRREKTTVFVAVIKLALF